MYIRCCTLDERAESRNACPACVSCNRARRRLLDSMATEFVTISDVLNRRPANGAVADGGARFLLPERAALHSDYLKDAITGGWQEGEQRIVRLAEFACVRSLERRRCDSDRPDLIEKVCEYLVWKDRYNEAPAGTEIPDFADAIPAEIALELLVAADYLSC